MSPKSEFDTGDETVRLLATLIRMQCDSQSEAIVELGRAGLGASRIAEVLGTSPGTVGVALQRAKAANSKAKTKKQ
jgi:DNA-directed RNA polymerase specialized sigma24 family protein